MDAYVEVIDPSGQTERYPIEGGQVTLGKSGTAGISLPTRNELELEHLLIAPRGREGCWVSTSQGALTPTTYKGKSFASGMVKWNSELVIGRIRVRVTNKKPKAKSSEGPSKVVIFGGVGIIAIAGWMLLRPGQEAVPSNEGITEPELFAAIAAECPPGDGDLNQRADAAEYRGHVTGDRYRYSPEDGVAAVRAYMGAVACLREASDSAGAEAVDEVREELQSAIEADYAGLKLHLHHSLAVDDWRSVVRDTERLAGLTAHIENDPYNQWLQQTLRIARARYEKQREEEAERR